MSFSLFSRHIFDFSSQHRLAELIDPDIVTFDNIASRTRITGGQVCWDSGTRNPAADLALWVRRKTYQAHNYGQLEGQPSDPVPGRNIHCLAL